MIRTICICGAGTMGSGITQVCAQSGFRTIQFDVNAEMLTSSFQLINHNLQSLVNKGKLPASEKSEILSRIQFSNDIRECVADVIVEAIVENFDAKVALFNELAEVNHFHTLFATNTSSISVSAIAEKVVNPSRVLGMHFFNPAPLMKLVEVVKGTQSSADAVDRLLALSFSLNKTPVLCNDFPGFIVNRVARHYYLEALRLVSAGLADIQTVDQLMESTGFKMGPFRLMDLIGMDVNFKVSHSVWQALGCPGRLEPSALQKETLDAGALGRKTGKGFYTYTT